MSLQLIGPRETFPTEQPAAHEWPFATVPPKMGAQMRRFAVDLATTGNVANMLLLLRPTIPISIATATIGTSARDATQLLGRRSITGKIRPVHRLLSKVGLDIVHGSQCVPRGRSTAHQLPFGRIVGVDLQLLRDNLLSIHQLDRLHGAHGSGNLLLLSLVAIRGDNVATRHLSEAKTLQGGGRQYLTAILKLYGLQALHALHLDDVLISHARKQI